MGPLLSRLADGSRIVFVLRDEIIHSYYCTVAAAAPYTKMMQNLRRVFMPDRHTDKDQENQNNSNGSTVDERSTTPCAFEV